MNNYCGSVFISGVPPFGGLECMRANNHSGDHDSYPSVNLKGYHSKWNDNAEIWDEDDFGNRYNFDEEDAS